MIEIQETLADGTSLFGWKSEPPLTPIAPDYTHYFTEKKIFSEEECKEWNDYLLEQEPILLDKFRTKTSTSDGGNLYSDGGTGLGATSITSRHAHFNVLKFDFHLVSKLKTKIFNGISCLLDVSGNTNWRETLYSNSWFNVLRQGESMNIHNHDYHKNTFYGFHLTINATEPSFTSYYHPIKFREEAFHAPNKIGYLTLFPLYIPHEVSPNRYEIPRVTIAGDTFPSTWINETKVNNKNLVEIGTYNGNV